MSIFSRFRGQENISPVPDMSENETGGQLLSIINTLKTSPEVYARLVEEVYQKNLDQFKSEKEVYDLFEEAHNDSQAGKLARLVEKSIGVGTMRTLSFLDSRQSAKRSVLKMITRHIESGSFEKQVEKGLYLNMLETYGIKWDLEKVVRDALQNFFDANNQTLDGVNIEIKMNENDTDSSEDPQPIKSITIRISAEQDYDWRELVHFGGTTKDESETDAGGFGEGTKVVAFIALRDFGATKVQAGSRDWKLDYYFDKIPNDSYRKEVKGLHAKKRKTDPQKGNYLEMVFDGPGVENISKSFESARELFYNSANIDFQDSSYDNRESGGFKILPLGQRTHGTAYNQSGHLYIAGQRTNYKDRNQWDTVSDMNVWVWKKLHFKDRDRGIVSSRDMEKEILPQIVETMDEKDLEKSVYDFKPLWDSLSYFSDGSKLLELIVGKLATKKIKLVFEDEYLANDLGFHGWIRDALSSKGFKICPKYMEKIGMKSGLEQFREWQAHDKVETNNEEESKISILKRIAKELEFNDDEIKDVWLFSKTVENSIMEGQYNPLFYWMSKEIVGSNLLDAMNTYVHEIAHKHGPHGDIKFDGALQANLKKLQDYIAKNTEQWHEYERDWKNV